MRAGTLGAQGCGALVTGGDAEEGGLGVEGVALLPAVRLAALAQVLEMVFSRQFCVLLKLCWATLAIIKAHRFLS